LDRRRCGGGGAARSTVWPTRIGRMRARIAPLVGEPGLRSEVATTLRGHHVRPRPSRLVAASLLGWTAT
jgi:hypothetical protein